jgi:chorismate synthase
VSRLRFLTAGESHGPELVAIVEGLPAGLPLTAERIDVDLARRQRGYGRGGRMKIERDRVRFLGGVRGGETIGGPVAMAITNLDHDKWLASMRAAPFEVAPEPVLRPRPGHADLAGALKYDRADLRDVLERASARETAARCLVGACARALLEHAGIDVFAHVVSIGDVVADVAEVDAPTLRERALASDLAVADPEAEARMREAIHAASHAGDTLGGVFEVRATGLLPGLGSHVHWDRRLDGRLAQALMSIQAIKGVEIGLGFEAARRRGSEVHDEIDFDAEHARYHRPTNGAGGLEGGITNGEPLVCRAAMKPISTLRRALRSVDVQSKQRSDAAFERSDICAVSAASVVGEAMVSIVLADALLEKLGGDSLRELVRNLDGYRAQIASHPTGCAR